MHFRHRQTHRQTDTDIVAYARDVYITSRAKKSSVRIGATWQIRLNDVRSGYEWAATRSGDAAYSQITCYYSLQ